MSCRGRAPLLWARVERVGLGAYRSSCSSSRLGRVALSRRVCQDLGWLNTLGQPKEMSARVALLRMEKDA